MWTYHTTFKVTIKATPFFLVYEVETILWIEFEINSFKIAINDRLTIQKSLRNRLKQLEGLVEIQRIWTQYIEAIQRKKIDFDKENKRREFYN